MEIIQLRQYKEEFNITEEQIEIYYNEWRMFHKKHKVISKNEIEQGNFFNSEDYSFENCRLNDLDYCILEKNKLVALCSIKCYYGCDGGYYKGSGIIEELFINPYTDWYAIFTTIAKYTSNQNCEFVFIEQNCQSHHPCIDTIMREFNALIPEVFSNHSERSQIIIPLEKANTKLKYDSEMELHLYDGHIKENDKPFTCHTIKVSIVKIKNKTEEKFAIVFKEPLLKLTSPKNQCNLPMKLWLKIGSEKYALHDDKICYNMRLNKLIRKEAHYSFNWNCIIFSIIVSGKRGTESDKILYDFFQSVDESYITKSKNLYKKIATFTTKKFNLNEIEDDYKYLSTLFSTEEKKLVEPENKTENYVYLIQKYDLNTGTDVYKFGKTARVPTERMKEHCNTSKILFIISVDSCSVTEKTILSILKNDKNIKQRKDIGNEYFSCENKKYMMNLIMENIKKFL